MYEDLSIRFDHGGVTLKLEGSSDDTDGLTCMLGTLNSIRTDEFLTKGSVDTRSWLLHRLLFVDATAGIQLR